MNTRTKQTPSPSDDAPITKEQLEKIIRHNRPGIAAHQIWRMIERALAQKGNVRI